MSKGIVMNRLEELLESAKKIIPTPQEREQQRRSFAYGNTQIENPRITRKTVDEEAEALESDAK
jgi:hypothetical protein